MKKNKLFSQKGITEVVVLAVMGVLAIVLPVVTKLVQQNQENRSQAAASDCKTESDRGKRYCRNQNESCLCFVYLDSNKKVTDAHWTCGICPSGEKCVNTKCEKDTSASVPECTTANYPQKCSGTNRTSCVSGKKVSKYCPYGCSGNDCADCNSTGGCASNQTCQNGKCVARFCSVNEKRCEDGKVSTCNSSGTAFENPRNCDTGACKDTKSCSSVKKVGEKCASSYRQCSGNVAWYCSSGKIVMENCAAKNLDCEYGKCVNFVCKDKSGTCTTLAQCNAVGGKAILNTSGCETSGGTCCDKSTLPSCCGTYNGSALNVPPSSGLCKTGSLASSVTTSGNEYKWSCGAVASVCAADNCSATKVSLLGCAGLYNLKSCEDSGCVWTPEGKCVEKASPSTTCCGKNNNNSYTSLPTGSGQLCVAGSTPSNTNPTLVNNRWTWTCTSTASSNCVTSVCSSKYLVETTSMSLTTKPAPFNIKVGDYGTVYVTLYPTTSTDSIKWTSSNTKVATVSGSWTSGIVFGKSAGVAIITATSGKISKSVLVTVEASSNKSCCGSVSGGKAVSSLTTSSPNLCLPDAKLSIFMFNSQLSSWTWRCAADEKETICRASNCIVSYSDLSGSGGSGGGGGHDDDHEWIPEPHPVPEYTVTLNPDEMQLNVGQTGVVSATISPEPSEDQVCTWESSDEEIATVSGDGLKAVVNAVKDGGVVISVSCTPSGATGSMNVTVGSGEIKSIKLVPNPLNLKVGETGKIEVETEPPGLTAKYKFESEDKEIAEVFEDGTVKGIKEGEVKVNGWVEENVEMKSSTTVKVSNLGGDTSAAKVSFKLSFRGISPGARCLSAFLTNKLELDIANVPSNVHGETIPASFKETNEEVEESRNGVSVKYRVFEVDGLSIDEKFGTSNTFNFIKVKGPAHLKRRMCQDGQDQRIPETTKCEIDLRASSTKVYDFSKYYLLTGDVNVDGVINSLDLSSIKARIKPGVDVGCGGEGVEGDLNLDGYINTLDINLAKDSLLERDDE